MPASLRVNLTQQDDQLLLQLSQSVYLPRRTRERATVLRLSAQGWNVSQIAAYFHWNPQTVRETIHRWHRGRWVQLWDEPRPGRTRRSQSQALEDVEETSHLCLYQSFLNH